MKRVCCPESLDHNLDLSAALGAKASTELHPSVVVEIARSLRIALEHSNTSVPLLLVKNKTVSPFLPLPRDQKGLSSWDGPGCSAKVSMLRFCIERGLFGVAETMLDLAPRPIAESDTGLALETALDASAPASLIAALVRHAHTARGLVRVALRKGCGQAVPFILKRPDIQYSDIAAIATHLAAGREARDVSSLCAAALVNAVRGETRGRIFRIFAAHDNPLLLQQPRRRWERFVSAKDLLLAGAVRSALFVVQKYRKEREWVEVCLLAAMMAGGFEREVSQFAATANCSTPSVQSKLLWVHRGNPRRIPRMVPLRPRQAFAYIRKPGDTEERCTSLVWEAPQCLDTQLFDAAARLSLEDCLDLLRVDYPFDVLTDVVSCWLSDPDNALLVLGQISARRDVADANNISVVRDRPVDWGALLPSVEGWHGATSFSVREVHAVIVRETEGREPA